jgi:hypothetical protein
MTHSRFGRLRLAVTAAFIVFAASAVVVTGWERPAAAGGPRGGGLTVEQLKLGLGCWESGGRYNIRNETSGAYGKYQIMPANWSGWARLYLGRGHAKQTAANQESVASGKLLGLRAWLNGWHRVLYWWLTGATGRDRSQWSDTANRYVDAILSMARRSATARGRSTIPKRCFSSPATGGKGGPPVRGDGPPHRTIHRRVVVSALHVRAHAGIGQPRLGILGYGDVVTVVDRVRDSRGRMWIHIARRGSPDGWVARWFTVLLR